MSTQQQENSEFSNTQLFEIENNKLFEIKFNFEYWKVILISHLVQSTILIIFIIGIVIYPLVIFTLIQFYVIYKNRKCFITDDFIYLSQEVPVFFVPFVRNSVERTVPLQKITDITITQSWIEKIFNMAQMKIETAGGAQFQTEGSADLVLCGIEEKLCRNYKQRILQLVANKRGEKYYGGVDVISDSFNNVNVGNELVALMKDMRDSLKRIEERQGFAALNEIA